MSLFYYTFIPIIIAFIAYFLNKKIKLSLAILNSVVFAYLFYQISRLYGQWDIPYESITYYIFDREVQLIFQLTPLSWLFIFMTTGAGLLIAIFTIKSQQEYTLRSAFHLNFAILVGSILGVVLAGDFLSLFIFWEIMTWSSFFLISSGEKKAAQKASFRYIILSTVGAYLMVTAIFIIYNQIHTLRYSQVAAHLSGLPITESIILIIMLAIPFIIKAGVFPFHVWVNGAHSNAPKEFSPFLSGLMLKVGIYGVILLLYFVPLYNILKDSIHYRGLPIFNYILAIFGGVTVITGTVLAIRQEDVKRLVAFSSISQMGYIIMALAISTPLGFTGGLLHLMNHMIFKTTIFLSIAAVIYRTKTTKMREMGGLIFKMPVTFAAYLIAIIALAGIPPTNGFISKWVIYQALIEKGYIFLSVAAFFGSIGSFMYVFKPLSTIFLGQLKPEHENIKEVPFLMQLPMFVLMALILLFGILPGLQMNLINQISQLLNITPVGFTLYSITGAFGTWNSLVIFSLFVGGFLLAFIIFISVKKSKPVGLMDTYTSGEYLDDPEAYHYAYQYFRPFDRVFDSFAARSLTAAYDTFAQNIVKLGNVFRKSIVTGNGQTYAFYMILFIVILAFAGWII